MELTRTVVDSSVDDLLRHAEALGPGDGPGVQQVVRVCQVLVAKFVNELYTVKRCYAETMAAWDQIQSQMDVLQSIQEENLRYEQKFQVKLAATMIQSRWRRKKAGAHFDAQLLESAL